MTVPLYARDVGEGTPLVLLHAYPLSSAMWLAQREDLAKRFRVITPDLRGFGGSVLGDEEPSIDIMADDVAALLRSKGIDRAVIGGLAMGGYVAMAFCRRHLDLVLGLVLANTKATADPPDIHARRQATAERIAAEESVLVLVDELLPELVGPTTFRQRALVYGRVRGLVQATPFRAAAWAQRAMAARQDAVETLRTIRAPALVIAGSEDGLATEDDARVMAEALPNAELLVMPRCGHLTAVEQPDLFNQAVGEFVSALGRTSQL
jgi:pimeloyl-ACP methyl ester carboxylesterase